MPKDSKEPQVDLNQTVTVTAGDLLQLFAKLQADAQESAKAPRHSVNCQALQNVALTKESRKHCSRSWRGLTSAQKLVYTPRVTYPRVKGQSAASAATRAEVNLCQYVFLL